MFLNAIELEEYRQRASDMETVLAGAQGKFQQVQKVVKKMRETQNDAND